MNITISIIYKGYASRLMQRGSFPVNKKRYERFPDHEAAFVANDWIKQIRREGHIEDIIEVMYNEDRDITELVKILDNPKLTPDNLPF